MAQTTADRSFDVILWGATGFTGRLVAEVLAASGARVALAGRNRRRLEEVRADLARTLPEAADLPVLVADADDPASLASLAEQTKVVCTTVGPYVRHGGPLVAACVDAATHYCDITGEVPFIRATIDAHHEAAVAAGVRVVHCCGFDSIPSDLGTLLLAATARERGWRLTEVRLQVMSASGGFSGGTVASMLNMVEQAAHDRGLRRLLADPYALNPEGERAGADERDRFGVHYDEEAGVWTAPFVMAAINTRVVRRSNALLGYAPAEDFRYSEVTAFKSGPAGALKALALTGGLGVFMAALRPRWTRAALERWVLPSPGEGPDEEARRRGRFKIRLLATAVDEAGAAHGLTATVADSRDPGYGSTAVMLAQSALCLAGDELSSPGGVLTPAAAMGMTLVDRLRTAGLTLRVAASDA